MYSASHLRTKIALTAEGLVSEEDLFNLLFHNCADLPSQLRLAWLPAGIQSNSLRTKVACKKSDLKQAAIMQYDC